jgi:N-hydroxyarylamine O-acetyltransferase
MDAGAYLARIGYTGPREPTAETLKLIHRAHLLAVPFENLDIPLGRPIVLSLPLLYEKIVRRRRGGFCYEINGLFAWLLAQLGFTVVMLSARVYEGARPGPEFDHLVLLVRMQKRLIADVGFGDSFLEPLELYAGGVAVQHGSFYRLKESGSDRILERRGADWEPQYVFSLTPHRLAEFEDMCRHHQTSAESIFTRKVVCSLATPDGRITLSNNRLIVTAGGRREEREVADAEEYRALLQNRFGIDLEEGAHVERLMEARPPRPIPSRPR